jgi:hypothetical protein
MGEQMFTMKSEVVGHLQSATVLLNVNKKICERRRFTISELPCDEFPHKFHALFSKRLSQLG